MKVYIELFIIDNIATSLAAAWLSYSFFGMRLHIARTTAAVAAGLAVSIVYPYFRLPLYITIPAKFAVGILLSQILFYGLKKTVPSAMAFFAATALIGGACFAASCLAEDDSLPYLVPSLISAAVAVLVKLLIGEARKKYAEMRFSCETDIIFGEKTARFRGFIDSGNGLTDNGVPVAVIKMSAFAAAFGVEELSRSSHRKTDRALGGGEQLILVKPCKIRLYYGENANIYKDVTLGVSALGFDREEDILLPSSVLGE